MNKTKTPDLLELPITDHQHNVKGAWQAIRRVAEGNQEQRPCRGQCHLKSGGRAGRANVAGEQRPEGVGQKAEGAACGKARGQEEHSLPGTAEASSGCGARKMAGGNLRNHRDQVTKGFGGPGTPSFRDTQMEQNRRRRL